MSEAAQYRWASLVIESDVPLPELLQASRARPPHIVVSRAPRRRGTQARTRCHEWRLPDGTPWATVGVEGRAHVMQFGRLAEFIIGCDGRSIQWRAPRATRLDTMRHLLLDQVLPTLASEHRMIGLHASAVALPGGAVAFAGPASRGKSTLAASFALDGHAIVTDDCLMLRWQRRWTCAVPSYPSLRLWTETAASLLGPVLAGQDVSPVAQYTSKLRLDSRVPAIGFRQRPVRLRRIYLLERGRGVTHIETLSRRQAYIELLKITFRLNPLDRAALHREVAALAAVTGHVPVARLRVPSRLGALADVRRDLEGPRARGARSMIQLTRSGLRVSSPDDVQGLADTFARSHAVRLPRFLEPALLQTVSRTIGLARFKERVHDHLDHPAVDLALDDPDAHSRLLVLFNDAGLFRFIDAVAGCGPLRAFQGTAYRMLPQRHHLASWHDDVKDARMVAMTLNLSPHGYAGGILQLRQTGSVAVLHEVANTGYGDAVVFRIGRGFEHRVTPIEPGPPKIAWAGWFRSEPSFLDVIHSGSLRLA